MCDGRFVRMALKIYTEDEEGKVIGETNGEQYVDYDELQAEVDAATEGNQNFMDWLRGIVCLGCAVVCILVFLPSSVASGNWWYSFSAIFFAALGVYFWWDGRKHGR